MNAACRIDRLPPLAGSSDATGVLRLLRRAHRSARSSTFERYVAISGRRPRADRGRGGARAAAPRAIRSRPSASPGGSRSAFDRACRRLRATARPSVSTPFRPRASAPRGRAPRGRSRVASPPASTSVGVRPVPPVVRMSRWPASARRASSAAISVSSSRTTTAFGSTSKPAARSASTRAGPEASSRSPAAERFEQVTTTASCVAASTAAPRGEVTRSAAGLLQQLARDSITMSRWSAFAMS